MTPPPQSHNLVSIFQKLMILALCVVHTASFNVGLVPRHQLSENGRLEARVGYFSAFRHSAFSTSLSSSSAIEFNDRFDRWRFLRTILEEESKDDVVNQVLFRVLDTALNYPRQEERDDSGSPEMTSELKEKIGKVLRTATDCRIPVCGDTDDGSILELLENILPDETEEEDAFKSIWDIVIELHGREMVKVNESNPTPEWKLSCLVVRLLIHYDFLTRGIDPEDTHSAA